MALTERTEADKIEIVGPFRAVQVRTATVIERDGEELTRSFHRHVIQAGDDYSAEDAEVQAVCSAVHTAELIAAYQAHLESMQPEAPAEEPVAEPAQP
jgi:hypothetical protein